MFMNFVEILVNQNKAALSPKKSMENCHAEYDFLSEFGMQPTYSKKAATKNIKSLGAIGCLASVTDSSVTKEVLVSLVKRFLFVDCEGEILTSPVGVVDSDQSDLKGYS
ncbi:hypothetical protein JHK85_028239 [Glycine max]|nr:hypothetical protein JHK87_027480 [Glycine soja]KAG4996800.1 hypothetical protein JHK85_028239 [Glycine max]KAG5003579.1 hypothetical protein JHK86_027718 [Glycine max]